MGGRRVKQDVIHAFIAMITVTGTSETKKDYRERSVKGTECHFFFEIFLSFLSVIFKMMLISWVFSDEKKILYSINQVASSCLQKHDM